MTLRSIPPVLAATLVPIAALAQDLPGDPVAGLEFARGHCAQCHYVESDWVDFYLLEGPDFTEIALKPVYTELALRAVLQTPYKRMPNYILTPAETDDVIAYILSLRAKFKDRTQ